MAEIAVSLVTRLVQVISTLAEKEASLLRSVPANTRYIKDELETIGAFLGVVETLQEDYPMYPMVKHWAEQVKDLAYDMEDCLEEHIVALTHHSSWSHQILNFRALHQFAAKLSDLRSRIGEVRERNRRYHLDTPNQPPTNYMTIMVVLDHVRSCSKKDADQTFTFDDRKKEVVSWVEGNNAEAPRVSASSEEISRGALKVAAIAGMCGSGKTALADEIYNGKRGQFSCHAWIRVSQTVNVTKVFRDMITQLSIGPSSQAGFVGEEEELAHHIQDKLRKNLFLIVFDDVWTTHAWDSIGRALPHISVSGSRIIVTTEIFQVAKHCMTSPGRFFWLSLLPELKSFKLLKDSVLESENLKMSDEDKEDFGDLDLHSLMVHEPPLDTIAEILRKCGGLKLAIKTVAQLLASKPPHQWRKLCDDLPSLLYNDPSLKEIKRVMTRSYKGLPPHLKPCFLYLSIFPEDSDINVATVMDQWVAEGLVREKTGMSAKAVAEGYLSELFDRSLIKASKMRRNRTCKTCWIHPMMRDVLVMISQEEKFSVTIGKNKSSSVPAKRFRHLTLNGQSDRRLVKSVDLSSIRSLTVFNEPSESIASLICSSQLKTLRVLDLSNASFQITQRDIRYVGELHHLRYLNLYQSSISELPSSIGRLTFLQLLNVRKTRITWLPSEITQLKRLQFLRASRKIERSSHHNNKRCSCNVDGVTVPKGIDNLDDIEWLDVVDIEGSPCSTIKALGKLTRLRHLGLTGLTKKNSGKVSSTLQNLSPSLIYLYLGACGKDGTLCCLPKDKESLEFPRLQSIKLDGDIGTMPEWISMSLTLAVVKFYRTNLQKNDIELLKRIPSLITLALLDHSYISEKLVFHVGAFTKLRRLKLEGLPELQVVKFEEKAVQQLRELIIVPPCAPKVLGKENLKRLRN